MKNTCVITFEGLNVNHLLNSLCRQNIQILGVKRQGKQCILQVDATQSQKVVAQLKEKCYNILDVRYTGASFWAKFAQKHIAMILCVVALVVCLALCSQYCLKIEVQGDFDGKQVIDALNQAGVSIGSSYKGFDADKLENALAVNLDAMYAVVNRKGSVLYVNVVAKRQAEQPIDMSKQRDIVSTVDGVVTSVLCEQGNLLVKVGDTVKVGDVLIQGVRVYNDGTTSNVYALGKITVKQTVQGSVTFNGYRTETQQTGNVYRNVGVVLFGKEYASSCNFSSYTVETTYKYIAPLNLALAYNTYYETQQVTVACKLADCLEDLQKQAYDNAVSICNFVPQGVEYTTAGNTVYATLYTMTDVS
nr:sporulation protein YqfD [Clostridia bacterium]